MTPESAKRNGLPELWPKFRWFFLACTFGAFVEMLLILRAMRIVHETGNLNHFFDWIQGSTFIAVSVGMLSILAIAFCEIAVPRILKKRALKTSDSEQSIPQPSA